MLTQKFMHRVLLVSLLTLLAVIGLRFRAPPQSDVKLLETYPADLAVRSTSNRFPPLGVEELLAEGHAKISPHGPAQVQGAIVKDDRQGNSEAAGTLDEIFEEVLSEDPMLRSFHLLREKVIRTAKEKSDYQSMLADKALLTESYNELSAAYINKNLDQGEELRRLMRIQYLNAALDWRDNPSRSIALDAIRQLLLAQFSSSDDRSAVAYGSLLGDKFDLFQHLMLSDPQEAERLLAQAKGTSSEKILRLAYEMAKQHNQHAN